MGKQDKHISEDDQLIRELFGSFTPDEAPASIKQNVMNRVLHDWVEQPVEMQSLINKHNRWWIIGGSAALIALTFLADSAVIAKYLTEVGIEAGFLSSINNSFKQVTSFASNIPSLVYIVVLGVIVLLGIDRLLGRSIHFQ